jgi:transposase
MMGRLNHDQGQLFYSFCLEEAVPDDHLVREIAAVLDLGWVRDELAPYYSSTGRPSIDPELMIRMLIIGYVFAIRSERLLCRELAVRKTDPQMGGLAGLISDFFNSIDPKRS